MRKSAVILVVVLTAIVLFAGCESSVVGVYKLKIGKDTAVLVLKAGNKATYSLSEDLAGIPIPYKVEDGSVVLIGATGSEIRFKIEGAGLRDGTGNLYKKQ